MARRRNIVVGASSGIGAATAIEAARRGGDVALLGRRKDLLESVAAECRKADPDARVVVDVHDVVAYDDVGPAFDRCVAALGGLDRLVYASGVMAPRAPERFDFDEDRRVFEVNVVGAVAWIDRAATYFEAAGSGQIVGISSIAGDRGRAPHPAYNASKACLSTFLEALYNRLWRKGVSVVTIKPGYVATDMLSNVDPKKLFWVYPADAAARDILDAADKGRKVAYVPWRWSLVALALKSIPSFLFRKLNV